MLQQHDLEQYHRIYAGPSISLAVQRLHDFVQPLKIYRCVYLPKQVICWHQTFRVHHFYDPALIFPTF